MLCGYCAHTHTHTHTHTHSGSSDRIDFSRGGWERYKWGFGKLDRNFWLGLEAMHHLSQLPGGLELKVELVDIESRGRYHQATYSHFSVGNESSNYALSVSGYNESSSLFDYFGYINGFPFSTADRDNDGINDFPQGLPPELLEQLGPDGFIRSCAKELGGGWWYGRTSLPPPPGECVPGNSFTARFQLDVNLGVPIIRLLYIDDPSYKHNRRLAITEVVMKVRRKHLLCGNVQPTAEETELAAIRRKYPQLFGLAEEEEEMGNGVISEGNGGVTNTSDGSGRVTNTSDGSGRVTNTSDGSGRVTNTSDGSGRVTNTSDGSGRVTNTSGTGGVVNTSSGSGDAREGSGDVLDPSSGEGSGDVNGGKGSGDVPDSMRDDTLDPRGGGVATGSEIVSRKRREREAPTEYSHLLTPLSSDGY